MSESMPYGDVPPGGYGTPPPFIPSVFIDGSKKDDFNFTPSKLADRPRPPVFNVDAERIENSTAGSVVAIDPTPLGPITVVVDATSDPVGITFAAPAKALKTPDNALVILSTLIVVEEDGGDTLSEWPIATFLKWDYVYRNDCLA